MSTLYKLISSLEKTMPFKKENAENISGLRYQMLQSDRFSFQISVYNDSDSTIDIELGVKTNLRYEIHEVEYVPVYLPTRGKTDDFYISKDPGLYPDLLIPYGGYFRVGPHMNKNLWITVYSNNRLGNEPFEIEARENNEISWKAKLDFNIIDISMTKDLPIHTEWFHQDSLLHYYNIEAWSEKHWKIIEKYIAFASKKALINALLTPIFTPPLDTEVGSERMTTQLLGISKEHGNYSFDFARLDRWCNICKKYGIAYLEIAHFFTQWGAKATPKIIANVDGVKKRIFGWDIPSTDPEYEKFLTSLIPALLENLEKNGYDREHVILHVSDEPKDDHLATYGKCSEIINSLSDGAKVVDALSNVEFYKKGYVKIPVICNDHFHSFIELGKEKELWIYYCVAQSYLVPNRFITMPSLRNRIMGTLIYRYDIKGFLHWGYNFYQAQFSKKNVNPYITTDCYYAFTAGDPNLVYPGEDGNPLSSIRNEVQVEGFMDFRFLKTAEERIGREEVCRIIDEEAGYMMDFEKYPHENAFFENLRNRIISRL